MERGHAPKDRRWPLEPETVSPEAPRGTAAPRTPRIYPAETKFEFHSSKTAKHSWVFFKLGYHWYRTSHSFQRYDMIQYLQILPNDYHDKSRYRPSPHKAIKLSVCAS